MAENLRETRLSKGPRAATGAVLRRRFLDRTTNKNDTKEISRLLQPPWNCERIIFTHRRTWPCPHLNVNVVRTSNSFRVGATEV